MDALGVALIVSLGPTFAILVTYLLAKRDSRIAATTVREAAEKVEGTLEVVHDLVNSRLTQALADADSERALRTRLERRVAKLEEKP